MFHVLYRLCWRSGNQKQCLTKLKKKLKEIISASIFDYFLKNTFVNVFFSDEALNTVTLETANYLSKLPAAQQSKEGIVEFVQKLKADDDGAKLLPNELMQIVNLRPQQVIFLQPWLLLILIDSLGRSYGIFFISVFAFLGSKFSRLLIIAASS